MMIWQGVKRRKQEEVNVYSYTNAALTANLVSFMTSFGESKENVSAVNYLPYQFTDTNSSKHKISSQLSIETINITAKLLTESKLPPKIAKLILGMEGMLELLENTKKPG